MIAHLTICWDGPLLKIVYKIYCITLVKISGKTKYDLPMKGRNVNHLRVWASCDNRIN